MKISSVVRSLGLVCAGSFLAATAEAAAITTFNFNINDLTDGVTLTDAQNSGRLTLGNCPGTTEGCSFAINSPVGTASVSVLFFDQTNGSFGAVLLNEGAAGPLSDYMWMSDSSSTATFWV